MRPAIPQLRCRCASYEGDAGASARAASADWLPAHRTLRTTTMGMLVARASCCCSSRCSMLPCAPCSPAAPCHVIVQEALLACARTSTASSSLRLLTRGFQLRERRDRAHPAQRRNLGCDALRDREVFPTFPSRLFQATHVSNMLQASLAGLRQTRHVHIVHDIVTQVAPLSVRTDAADAQR